MVVLMCLATACKPTQQPQTSAKELEPTPKNVAVEQKKYDGPFGLQMGLSKHDLKSLIAGAKEIEADSSVWESTSVPTPHSDFESYFFRFSEKSGLCSIGAIGKDITTGGAGTELKSQFDTIDEALTNKYGKGKKFDYTTDRYSSLEFWMLELLQKNRTLAKYWDREEKSNLPDWLTSISIEAKASDIHTGYISLRYEFSNIDQCISESKSNANKGL